jgi:hypothetical protein
MSDSASRKTRIVEDLDVIDAALAGRATAPGDRPLADLALLLRDERSTPDAEAAHRLDERLAASLAESRQRGRRPQPRRWAIAGVRRTWWPALAAVACVLLAAVFVLDGMRNSALPGRVGASDDAAGGRALPSAGSEAARPEAAGGSTAQSADPAAREATAPGVAAPPVGSLSDPTDLRERRLVERSAFLTLTTKPEDLADVASRIVRATDDAGGFVASSTVGETADDAGGGSFELRVPVRELPRTLAALSRLAQVSERSQSTRDVTADAGRTARRVAELRAERRGLLRALERAESANEAARIRARLRVVARRTQALRAAGRRLRDRAAFATISVSLVADADAGAGIGDGRWTPGDAVRTAIRVLEVAVGVALVAAALAVPLGLVAAAALLTSRVVTRRRRSRVLDAS